MSRSIQEEIIAALWAICALLAFGFGFNSWGALFCIKAAMDTCCSISYAFREHIAARKEKIKSQETS